MLKRGGMRRSAKLIESDYSLVSRHRLEILHDDALSPVPRRFHRNARTGHRRSVAGMPSLNGLSFTGQADLPSAAGRVVLCALMPEVYPVQALRHS